MYYAFQNLEERIWKFRHKEMKEINTNDLKIAQYMHVSKHDVVPQYAILCFHLSLKREPKS